MKTEDSDDAAEARPQPSPTLRSLDRLVGTWELSGEVRGRVRYEWAEGGFFLVQHVDLEQDGGRMRGLEVIGHEHTYGSERSDEIRSRFYGFTDGRTLDYVYEINGDTLTIWSVEKGSPAYYEAAFSSDGSALNGRWVYPGGGGYVSNAVKVEQP